MGYICLKGGGECIGCGECQPYNNEDDTEEEYELLEYLAKIETKVTSIVSVYAHDDDEAEMLIKAMEYDVEKIKKETLLNIEYIEER